MRTKVISVVELLTVLEQGGWGYTQDGEFREVLSASYEGGRLRLVTDGKPSDVGSEARPLNYDAVSKTNTIVYPVNVDSVRLDGVHGIYDDIRMSAMPGSDEYGMRLFHAANRRINNHWQLHHRITSPPRAQLPELMKDGFWRLSTVWDEAGVAQGVQPKFPVMGVGIANGLLEMRIVHIDGTYSRRAKRVEVNAEYVDKNLRFVTLRYNGRPLMTLERYL